MARRVHAPALLTLAAACAGPQAPPSDAERYRDAVGRADPAACATIVAAEVAGECVAFAAREQAAAGALEAAWATCQAMAPGPWRDECHFLVVDAAEDDGDDARRWCAEAGAFRTRCLGHALNREADALLAGFPRGEEAAALAALGELTRARVRGGEADGKAWRLLVDHLAQRDPERPFHAGVCGTAPRALCRDVYIERARKAARPWRAACGRVVSTDRAAAAGQPVWEPDMEAVAQEAWSALCATR